MQPTDTISARRLAGFIALTLAILVGTLALGFVLSGPAPIAVPTDAPTAPSSAPTALPTYPQPGATAAPTTPSSTLRAHSPSAHPGAPASDVPPPGGTIPPFVPVPSGPFP